MALSNVLALEGLSLFFIRLAVRRAVFSWLSRAVYAIAFFHFQGVSVEDITLIPAAVTDWGAFGRGLPAALFMIVPSFVPSRWLRRGGTRSTSRERTIEHVRTFAAGLLALRLLFHTVLPAQGMVIWTVLALLVLCLAWVWRSPHTLPTLGACFLGWAHLYFFFEWEHIRRGSYWWLLPCAIALALIVLVCRASHRARGVGQGEPIAGR